MPRNALSRNQNSSSFSASSHRNSIPRKSDKNLRKDTAPSSAGPKCIAETAKSWEEGGLASCLCSSPEGGPACKENLGPNTAVAIAEPLDWPPTRGKLERTERAFPWSAEWGFSWCSGGEGLPRLQLPCSESPQNLYLQPPKSPQGLSSGAGLFCCCLFWLFRAAPEAYGGSQARSRIRATAAGLHHSHSHVGSLTH